MLTFHPDVKILQTLEAQAGWRVLSAWDWDDGGEPEFRDEPLIFWVTLRSDRHTPAVRYGSVSVEPVTVSAEGDVGTFYDMCVEYVLVREGADLAEHKRILLQRVQLNRKVARAEKRAVRKGAQVVFAPRNSHE